MPDRRTQFAETIDGQLPTAEQHRELGMMAASAFIDIRLYHQNADLVFAIADTFHELPAVVHSPHFSWSWLLVFLEDLDRRFPSVGHRYIVWFDRIIGFAPCPPGL